MIKVSIIILLFFGLANFSDEKLASIKEADLTPIFLAPPNSLKHVNLGYAEVISDFLWLRLVQDFETCRPVAKSIIEKRYKPDGNENYGEEDREVASEQKVDAVTSLVESDQADARCNKGWGYHMLDMITELTPKFKLAYETGTRILSIITDDREGARLMYDKSIENFPSEWKFIYGAAYHYLYEVRDLDRAAYLLNKAGDHGAPEWVYSLSARLYTEVGRAELGISILEDSLKKLGSKGEYAERIKKRLNKLYKSIQK